MNKGGFQSRVSFTFLPILISVKIISRQLLSVFLASDVKLAFLEVFQRDGLEHRELQFLRISLIHLLETPHHDKVHAVEELIALCQHTQAHELAQPVHLIAGTCRVHYWVSKDHAANEKHHEVAELSNFIRS